MNRKRLIYSLCALSLGAGATAVAAPTQGAYVQDKTQYFTNSASERAVSQINSILCMVKQTNYSDFTGQGVYLAQADMNACGLTGGTGNNVPRPVQIVVESTNPANKPQTVKMWFQGVPVGKSTRAIIQARATIEQSPTQSNPYGIFDMNYIAYELDKNGQTTNTEVFRGFISSQRNAQTNQVVVKYFENQNNSSSKRQVALVKQGSSGGYAKARIVNSQGNTSLDANIGFSPLWLLNDLNGSNKKVCYDRTQYQSQAYRYGLYKPNGDRVSGIESGFPIRYTTQGGQTVNGWLGYYGLWLPGNINFSDGDAVTKVVRDGNNITGSLVVKDGRLEKESMQQKTLAQLANTPIIVHPQSNASKNKGIVISWNNNKEQFEKTADCAQAGQCQKKPLASSKKITADTLFNNYADTANSEGIDISVEGIGSTFLTLKDNQGNTVSLDNQSTITVWTRELVQPTTSSDTLTLYCYQNCRVYDQGSGQWSYAFPQQYGQTSLEYTINKQYNATNGYTMQAPVVDNGALQQGSKSMVRQTALRQVGLVDDPNLSSPGKIYDGTIETRYIWESGPQDWQKFITFKYKENGSNKLENFDAPMRLVYEDNGTQKFLEYEGFGELNGIPGDCINPQTGKSVQCGGNTIFVPAYTIPTGTKLTRADDASKEFFVKQLEVGQTLTPLQGNTKTTCVNALQTEVNNAASLTLPTSNGWSDPQVGNTPNVSNSPDVINGVTQ